MEFSQYKSGFFELPKEIRLIIYELVLGANPLIKVGNRGINEERLAEWPVQPSICRTCRVFRAETLETYYSIARLQLNIQRPSGEYMVLRWLLRLAISIPEAFNKIRHVSIIAGIGYREPPKEYKIDVQCPAFVSATRPCAAAYLYNRRGGNMRSWSHLVSGALKRRLKRMPGGDSPGFSVAANLRDVIAIVGELSGYGLDGDYTPWIDYSLAPSAPAKPVRHTYQEQSPLFRLPKELRLAVYDHAFTTDGVVTKGQRALRGQLLTDGPVSPGLLRTCSLLRDEALPIYFFRTHFVLNVQRLLCEEAVLEWIRRCSIMYPTTFQHINHVSVIAGSGIRQPPRQFEFHVQRNLLISTIDCPIRQPYTLPAMHWYPPPLDPLLMRLQQMPQKGQSGFDVAQNIREIIDVLSRCSD